MYDLTYTLLSEGTTDQALIPIINWALEEKYPHIAFTPQYADLSRLQQQPHDLADKIRRAVELYPCQVLFIHRDSDNRPVTDRYREIENAYRKSGLKPTDYPYVRIVPIHMTEAWLLIDETAIRRAAGKPSGRVPLLMPPIHAIEGMADPKTKMYELLRTASEATGRRAKNSADKADNMTNLAQTIKETAGFAKLRDLSAFKDFERGIEALNLP